MIRHHARHNSGTLHVSARIFYISLIAEATVQWMTFGFHPNFDVTNLLFTSALPSSRFSQGRHFPSTPYDSLTLFAADYVPWTSYKLVKF